MADQGVNTASLGNAVQDSGFRREKTPNIQPASAVDGLRRGEHPTSNIQRPLQQADVQCSRFGVRCLAPESFRSSMFESKEAAAAFLSLQQLCCRRAMGWL